MAAMHDPVLILRLANSFEDLVGVAKLAEEYETSKDGTERFQLKSMMASKLTYAEKEEIYSIFEKNMAEYYHKTWGLKKDEKMNELFHPTSRVFALYRKTEEIEGDDGQGVASGAESGASAGSLAAYTIFRFEWDDEEEPEYPVLYCYELQIQPSFQGRGLGKKLMEVLNETAKKLKMIKVMLTCFNINETAMNFYKAIGFDLDHNSPTKCGFPADYEILSKAA